MQRVEGNAATRAAILKSNAARAFSASPEIEAAVRQICDDVQARGDQAVIENCRQFDCPDLQIEGLRVTPEEIEAAWNDLPDRAKNALQRAAKNLEAFHRAQKPQDFSFTSSDGARLGNRWTPIARAGIYAPNGRAAYPSTVLMLAVPAAVAGVRDIVLATPAAKMATRIPSFWQRRKSRNLGNLQSRRRRRDGRDGLRNPNRFRAWTSSSALARFG